MSKLDNRVSKLERIDPSQAPQQQGMSDQDLRILQQIAKVQLHDCPDLAEVTETDTDPQTFKEIQRTLAEARGEFALDPTPQRSPPPARRPSSPGKRRLKQQREDDPEAINEAIAFVEQAIARASESVDRVDRAVEATRKRMGCDA